MIIWGGQASTGNLNSGARYNPDADSWTPTSTTNVPEARSFHTAVWTGNEMIVWGGGWSAGGRYHLGWDTWTSASTTDAPSAREVHTGTSRGPEMEVLGGS